jgi:hypothetical protein
MTVSQYLCAYLSVGPATSQLFLQAPKLDDQLPVSADGGVPDIHITAFLSAIDNLLTAGRSNSPTKVLNPMKSVVNAVTAVIEDVRLFEQRPPRDRSDVDIDALRSLYERAEATLSNLVTATKTHATSSGMSPVSLLDAAASHVSATVTEIGRTLCIRKATKIEQEQFASPTSYIASTGSASGSTNGFSPSLRAVEEIARSSLTRKGSAPRSDGFSATSSGPNRFGDSRRQVPSEPSSSDASSPPPIFDQPPINSAGVASDDSATADGPEDAWAELKVCSCVVYFFTSLRMTSLPLRSRILKRKRSRSYMRYKVCYLASAAQPRRRRSTKISRKSSRSCRAL